VLVRTIRYLRLQKLPCKGGDFECDYSLCTPFFGEFTGKEGTEGQRPPNLRRAPLSYLQ
jgi:hypothetical protein